MTYDEKAEVKKLVQFVEYRLMDLQNQVGTGQGREFDLLVAQHEMVDCIRVVNEATAVFPFLGKHQPA